MATQVYLVCVSICLLALATVEIQILDQVELQSSMFTMPITGDLTPLKPSRYVNSSTWSFPVEVYEIDMVRAYHQFLPSNFNPTEIFAYAGKVNGQIVASYPGPTLSVLEDVPIYVIYTNNIQGSHLFPLDTAPPFNMTIDYQNQVCTVPHAHGLELEEGPDGQPMGCWTKSGYKGSEFYSLNSQNLNANQAMYRYYNTKEGLYWYHDHAMAITRLNVYAGLVGFYQIIDAQISRQEQNIFKMYGDLPRKYFAIADKTFQSDGQLFYSNGSDSSDFQYWIPEFFGNTMTVNGKVWPRVDLQPKMYRIVFLNGCQSRFLNIYFQNNNQKLDFQIFRRDSDYLSSPVTVKEHLLLLGGRIEIFLDLTDVVGTVTLGNNAASPYPMGEEPNEFMSQIMKIFIGTSSSRRNLQQTSQLVTNQQSFLSDLESKFNYYTSMQSLEVLDFINEQSEKFLLAQNLLTNNSTEEEVENSLNSLPNNNDYTSNNLIEIVSSQVQKLGSQVKASMSSSVDVLKKGLIKKIFLSLQPRSKRKNQRSFQVTNVPYPRFPEGVPYFMILADVFNSRNELSGMMIDGVPVSKGSQGLTFRASWVYDFYIINLTMDDHPFHIHLVNFQIIKRFKFKLDKYKEDWQSLNGRLQAGGVSDIPTQIDVRSYKIPGSDQDPKEEQKQFLDVIHVPNQKVTVARVKFSNQQGKPFPFDIRNAQFVMHCHMLEHEDNQMMRIFRIQ